MTPGTWMSLLLVAAPRGADERHIADLYQPGDESAWVVEQAGEQIGEHSFRYEGLAGPLGAELHRFSSRVRLMPTSAFPVEQRYQAELWTDSRGVPVRHTLHAMLGDQYSRVEMTFGEGQAEVRLVQGPGSQDLEIAVPEGALVQANNFVGYFELLLGLDPVEKGGTRNLQLVSSNALRVFPYQVTWTEELPEELVENVGKEGGEEDDEETLPGSVLKDSLGETLFVAGDGRILRLEITAQQIVIRRTDETPEPFTIEPPAVVDAEDRFHVEEVTISHDGVSLAGSLTRRNDAAGKLPAVFFISGSGLQDRHGLASGIDLGTHEILDRLTEEGFLVLRVDDRGAGQSTGPMESLGFEELVEDARACVDYLLAREDVDADRVAIIGHSEGGVTAPILAAERSQIAAIVLMAATGRSLIDVIMDQNEWALDNAGVTGAERETTLAEARRVLELICADAEIQPKDLSPKVRAALPQRAWFQDHARVDPLQNIRRVRCPVLILQGAKDFQVSAEKDARVLQAALDEAGHEDHRLQVFPALDHLFKKAAGEKSRFSDYFKGRPVDAEFLDVLSDWLSQRLRPRESD